MGKGVLLYFAVSENIHRSPVCRGFLFAPPPPLWKFQFSFILSFLKFWPLRAPPPQTFCGEVYIDILGTIHFKSCMKSSFN